MTHKMHANFVVSLVNVCPLSFVMSSYPHVHVLAVNMCIYIEITNVFVSAYVNHHDVYAEHNGKTTQTTATAANNNNNTSSISFAQFDGLGKF